MNRACIHATYSAWTPRAIAIPASTKHMSKTTQPILIGVAAAHETLTTGKGGLVECSYAYVDSQVLTRWFDVFHAEPYGQQAKTKRMHARTPACATRLSSPLFCTMASCGVYRLDVHTQTSLHLLKLKVVPSCLRRQAPAQL